MIWKVPHFTANQKASVGDYHYQCTVHGGMVGNIFVVGGPQHIVGVLTATSFSGSIAASNVDSGTL